MTLGQKIEQLLEEKEWTQIELAHKLGLSTKGGIVSKWINGTIKPGRENKKKMAELFSKNLSYFDDDDAFTRYPQATVVMDRREETQKNIEKLLNSFPLIRPVEVRKEISSDFFELYIYTQPVEYLPIMFEAKPEAAFALKIANEKACPWAKNGEYALFSPVPANMRPLPHGLLGKTVLAKINDEYTIKKFFKEKDYILLEDKNKKRKKYSPFEVEITAQLIAFYRKP